MAEFNMYNRYALSVNQTVSDNEEIERQELARVVTAFMTFHKPETYEERQQFVNDALQGRNYNQTLEYNGETMDFEFTDERVQVTLHSDNPERDNTYFAYQRQ